MIKKSSLLSLAAIFGLLFLSHTAFSQACHIETDSIISGDDLTEHAVYFYDAQDQLVKREQYDSSATSVSSFDTLFYTGTRLDSTVSYSIWNGTSSIYHTTRFTYNGSGQTSIISESGDNGNGPWTRAYDLYYNGAGELTDMKLNALSISGNPEGFNGNFENMVWLGGNLVYADLIIDFGLGIDTIELSLTYDDKSNLERHFYIGEGPDVLFQSNLNNVLQVVFENDEAIGSAGSFGVNRSYTYYPDGEVATMTEIPAIFEDASRTTQYTYSGICTPPSALGKVLPLEANIHPNPLSDKLFIELGTVNGPSDLRLYNMNGSLVVHQSIANSTQLALSDLPTGIYVIEIHNNGRLFMDKLIKF